MLTLNSSDNPYPTTTLLFVLRNMTVLGVARHDTELTKYNKLSTKSDSLISTKGIGMNRVSKGVNC